ncbi:MAG: bifunctional riboflavin kinase/FAD synthetase [Muribaculaceae bacterium]|nr:bifunctional riboflavin kinase/FAD synthetase [Muribaculaceae bacterium]
MKIISAPTSNLPKLVAGIGFFDGVHLGHQSLINELKRSAAEAGISSAVVTFRRHPRSVLNSEYRPQLINLFNEKMQHLSDTGIDYVIALDFDIAMSKMSSYEFIKFLRDKFNLAGLYIGYDHRFGHNRSDGFEDYKRYGKELGVEIYKAGVALAGTTPISSSVIRRFLKEGDISVVNEMLTYRYSLSGKVVSGYGVGRTIGFKTANIEVEDLDKLIPGNGVYAVYVKTADGVMHKGMMNIGNRPTVHDNVERAIEVHILDFDGELYENNIEIFFEKFMRPERKMSGLDELKSQLSKDRDMAREILK